MYLEMVTTQLHEAHWELPAWSFDGAVYRFENYRIEHVDDDDGGWLLTVGSHWPTVYAGSVDGRYPRLAGAKAWMRIHRMRVIRRAKIIRHAFVAALGLLAIAIGFNFVGEDVTRLTVPGLLLSLAGIAVFIRELINLISHLAGDTDFFEMRPQTRVDRALLTQLERFAAPPKQDVEIDTPIRIVDPF